MAGLCAAARARELGARRVVLREGRPRRRLDAAVVVRRLALPRARRRSASSARAATRSCSARSIERLDDALAWLRGSAPRSCGRRPATRCTVGLRFDPRSLTDALVRAAGEIRLGEPAPGDAEPLVLATGGFQGDRELVAEHIAPGGELLLRANPWSAGDGLRLGLARGAALSSGMDEFYGRAMPAPPTAVPRSASSRWRSSTGVTRSCSTSAARSSRPIPSRGRRPTSCRRSRSGRARAPGTSSTRKRSAASPRSHRRRDGRGGARGRGEVLLPNELGIEVPGAYRYAVHVVAGITHTIGGVRIDAAARVLREDGTPVDGLYAAGADAGGIATGGYASGLASALVFGRIAGRDRERRRSHLVASASGRTSASQEGGTSHALPHQADPHASRTARTGKAARGRSSTTNRRT